MANRFMGDVIERPQGAEVSHVQSSSGHEEGLGKLSLRQVAKIRRQKLQDLGVNPDAEFWEAQRAERAEWLED